jgi:hypothetical protein
VLRLGMEPGDMTDNLLLAADRLGLCRSNPQALASSIQEWREGWARVLYPSFGLPDPLDPMAIGRGNKDSQPEARPQSK